MTSDKHPCLHLRYRHTILYDGIGSINGEPKVLSVCVDVSLFRF